MFNYARNSIFSSNELEGKYNFSLEKSEFFPLSATPGDRTKTFETGNLSSLSGIEVDEETVNRYYKPYLNSWGGDPLDRFRLRFITQVLKLSSRKIHITPHSLRFSYGRTLLNISEHRLKTGQAQVVEGISFRIANQATGVYHYNEVSDLFYLFTFKTKYLEDMQLALLQGKPMKSHWFTVFMLPKLNTLIPNGKPVLALRKNFIEPLQERGIEIVMSEDILEDLSYRTIEIPIHTFAPDLVRSRDAKKEARNRIFQEMLVTRKDAFKLQKDWNMGLAATYQVANFLARTEGEYFLTIYTEYIQKTYYPDIEMEDGMRRTLVIGENSREQVWEDGKWEINDGANVVAYNDLFMTFTSYPEKTNSQIAVNIEEEKFEEILTYFIAGYSRNYKEGEWIGVNSVFNTMYKIVNYRAITHSFESSAVKPNKFFDLNKNLLFHYKERIDTYISYNDIIGIEFNSVKYLLNQDLVIMLSSDWKNKKDIVKELDPIYFADEDKLYVKDKGILMQVIVTSLHVVDAVTLLQNCKLSLYEDSSFQRIFLNRKEYDVLLKGYEAGHSSFLWSEEVEDEEYISHVEIEERIEVPVGNTDSPSTFQMVENINRESHDF